MNKPPQDLGIPVLTEVISLPEADAAPAPADAQPAPPAAPQPPPSARPAPVEGWLDEEWSRIEQRIRERVLTQLLERTDAILDQRIREGLADVLQYATERLAADIRQGLHQTLDDVITDVVKREIERTRFAKN